MFTLYVEINLRPYFRNEGTFNLDDESIKDAIAIGKTFPGFWLRPDTYEAELYLTEKGLL